MFQAVRMPTLKREEARMILLRQLQGIAVFASLGHVVAPDPPRPYRPLKGDPLIGALLKGMIAQVASKMEG